MDRKTEIREILLGNYNSTGDVLRYERNTANVIWSVNMPIVGTRLLGPVKMSRMYQCTDASLKRVNKACLKALSNMGLLAELESAPEVTACYRRSWYMEPVIVTAETDAETLKLTLTAYTRRALFSRLSLIAFLRKIDQELNGVERIPGRKVRAEKRAERKTKRAEKKAQRKQKRKQSGKTESAEKAENTQE